jgi:hypothetical protein
MHPVGFESTISASERPKTYALDGHWDRFLSAITLKKKVVFTVVKCISLF